MPRYGPDYIPKYRRHAQSGQAVVTLSGFDHMLGARDLGLARSAWLLPVARPFAAVADQRRDGDPNEGRARQLYTQPRRTGGDTRARTFRHCRLRLAPARRVRRDRRLRAHVARTPPPRPRDPHRRRDRRRPGLQPTRRGWAIRRTWVHLHADLRRAALHRDDRQSPATSGRARLQQSPLLGRPSQARLQDRGSSPRQRCAIRQRRVWRCRPGALTRPRPRGGDDRRLPRDRRSYRRDSRAVDEFGQSRSRDARERVDADRRAA